MPDKQSRKGIVGWFERGIVWFAQGLLMVLLTIAVLHIVHLFWVALQNRAFAVADIHQLQLLVQRGFAGVLMLMLGLELVDTLHTYFTEHRVRLEVILTIATIALGRHVILLDVEHLDGVKLLGISALALALTTGYFLVKRSTAAVPAA